MKFKRMVWTGGLYVLYNCPSIQNKIQLTWVWMQFHKLFIWVLRNQMIHYAYVKMVIRFAISLEMISQNTSTNLVNSNISYEELQLISSHSVCVFAWILLHEAGKDGPYIKLYLWWLGNCFELYLRNTNTFTNQHDEALECVHAMTAKQAATTNMNTIVQVNWAIDLIMDELEDDD